MKKYKVCTKCETKHYENCPTCFGFGIAADTASSEVVPITAREAMRPEQGLRKWKPCPTCLSTPKGIPHE